MADLSFRTLRREDMDEAARIHRAARDTVQCIDSTLHTPEEDRHFYREIVFGECTIIGAFLRDALVGHVAMRPGWIDHLYVDPARQSRGIGSALLKLAKRRMDDIQLWTFEANSGARRFYERHGFFVEERSDGARNEESQPDLRYHWRR